MLNTAKRGRDMIADNVSLAQATAKAYGNAFEQSWEGLRGSVYYLGYQGARNPTFYPTSYLATGSGSGAPTGQEVQQDGEVLLREQATYNWR